MWHAADGLPMKLAAAEWVNVRLALGATVATLLVALSLFSPFDFRVKLLVGSLLVTVIVLFVAALKGNRSTHQAAAFCIFATLTIAFAGSFADTESLAALAAAGAFAILLVVVSLPRAPPEPREPAEEPPPTTPAP